MERNCEYKQIFISQGDIDVLKGKTVDKVGFFNRRHYDENIFAITFTDKTFVAIGADYSDREGYSGEPMIDNFCVIEPEQYHGGLGNHVYLDDSHKPKLYNGFVKVLSDLGIWDVTAEDIKKAQEEIDKREEEMEYKQYLYLKEKFEKK